MTKHTSSISSLLISLDSVVFWVFWDLVLFLSSYCHPCGGRDSLKNQRFSKKSGARVPGLGQIVEITCRIVLTKKMRGHPRKKQNENREIVGT